MNIPKSLENIALLDGRYNARALHFVHQGLGFTVRKIQEQTGKDSVPRHITGKELSLGLAELAVQKWGMLAKLVLNQWNVHTTRDFGEIVYMLVKNKYMSAQPDDRIEDFNNVFDFDRVFISDFKISAGTKSGQI